MTKIEHRELLRRLRRLSKAVTVQIEDVNFGGCGVLAGMVGTQLLRLGVMVEVVTPCDYFVPAAEARGSVSDPSDPRGWDDNGLSRSHLAVRFRSSRRTYTWDSDGTRPGGARFGGGVGYATDARFGNGLSVLECVRMSSRQAGWNRDFDRKQIPLLWHLVQQYLARGL